MGLRLQMLVAGEMAQGRTPFRSLCHGSNQLQRRQHRSLGFPRRFVLGAGLLLLCQQLTFTGTPGLPSEMKLQQPDAFNFATSRRKEADGTSTKCRD